MEQSVEERLTTYLLNPNHPDGGSKAAWFKRALGFTRENYDDLVRQIVFDPSTATLQKTDVYGERLEQRIAIVGANGRTIDGVRFYWIREPDGSIRLLTAKPPKK